MSDFDTGDVFVHVPSGDVYIVACVHDDIIRTAGVPEKMFGVTDCAMKDKATDQQFRQALSNLAAASSNNHRPVCARQRLGELHTEECYYGC